MLQIRPVYRIAGLLWILLLAANFAYAQEDKNHRKEVIAFQKKLDHEYKTPGESPLHKEEMSSFRGLPYFEIDAKYRVTAQFTRTENEAPFEMPTTTDRKPVYQKYGELSFELDGKPYKLSVFQSHSLRAMPKYKNHLFLPFTDLTNGDTSYEGGRFIDLEIPEGNTIVIDFNKAYNPYCAYNHDYSCPIPPKENHLNVAIEAGVKQGLKK